MRLELAVQYRVPRRGLPAPATFRRWATAALDGTRGRVEVAVRIIDEEESAALNATYRHKEGPTNVLSFPYDVPVDAGTALLGDLAVCAPVVRREARAQGKSERAHWAHMVVHGCLHLVGYDHQTAGEAEIMEAHEREILSGLGYPDPYRAAAFGAEGRPRDARERS